MQKKIKVAVVGGGWPSIQHIKGYLNNTDVELVAISDIDKKKCLQISLEYGIKNHYSDYEEMLDKEKPDIVSICTPNYLHSVMSIKAMENGAHVICEKPMAINAKEALTMMNVQKKTGKLLMIAHQRRFCPEVKYLKKIISNGELGKIYHIRTWWVRRQGIPGIGGWFTQKDKSGGGALIDIGVHMLDLALYFLGFPDPIGIESSWGSKFGIHGKGCGQYARVDNSLVKKFDVDDYVFAHVNYPEGVSLQLQCSWAGFIKQEEANVEIWGEKGGARLYPLEIYTEKDGLAMDIVPKFEEINPFNEEVRMFIDAVKKGGESPYNPTDGVKVLELIEMIYDVEKKTKANSREKSVLVG